MLNQLHTRVVQGPAQVFAARQGAQDARRLDHAHFGRAEEGFDKAQHFENPLKMLTHTLTERTVISIQWNSHQRTIYSGTSLQRTNLYTVEPLYKGQVYSHYIQWNLSTKDKSTVIIYSGTSLQRTSLQSLYTVEPLYKGQVYSHSVEPLYKGQVYSHYYTAEPLYKGQVYSHYIQWNLSTKDKLGTPLQRGCNKCGIPTFRGRPLFRVSTIKCILQCSFESLCTSIILF